MNTDHILSNDEYKLFFLKAIMLGINYGRSDNVEYYANNIQNEINSMTLKVKNKNENIVSHHNVTTTEDDLSDIKKEYFNIKRYDDNIKSFENSKGYILSLIQRLSENNYSSNYSKISLLKNNLNSTLQEIEKNKLLLQKYKDSLNPHIVSRINKYMEKYNANANTETTPTVQMQFQQQSNQTNQVNTLLPSNQHNQNSENLVGELQSTLDKLSNLFT